MPESQRAARQRQLAPSAAVAWLVLLLLGLAAPFVLLVYSVLALGTFESSTPIPGRTPTSEMLWVIACISSSAATVVIALLGVRVRHFGVRALAVWTPGIPSLMVTLFFLDLLLVP